MENSPPPVENEKAFPAFERFPRVSLFLLVLLTLATIGFYVPYWLYIRTRILNQLHPTNTVPTFIVALCMGGYIMLIALVYQLPAGINAEELMKTTEFSRLMDAAMLLNVFQLMWAVLFLQRLNACTRAQTNDAIYGRYFILVLAHLFIVNIFYLQYKINQILDSKHKPEDPTGILQA